MTLFKQVNMINDLPLDGEKDVVLVMRDNEGEHDFMLHLPPFKGDSKNFPSHVGTAITIAACLYEKDVEFSELIAAKFKQYAREYLERVYPGRVVNPVTKEKEE